MKASVFSKSVLVLMVIFLVIIYISGAKVEPIHTLLMICLGFASTVSAIFSLKKP